MILDTELLELFVNNKAIPAYSIEKESGVSRDVISKIRRGERDFNNLQLNSLTRLQRLIDDTGFKVSYDYEKMIKELKEDIFFHDVLIFERRKVEGVNYWAVVDWYFELEQVEKINTDHKYTVENVKDVLEEMIEMNNLI